ncbi:MAG: hypothetical protein ACLTZB_09655 [Streptococcus salivarius]
MKLTKQLVPFLPMSLCKSIVSTELVTKTQKATATMFNVLTGFKFIGEKIHEFETQHNHTYMLGFEESFIILSNHLYVTKTLSKQFYRC